MPSSGLPAVGAVGIPGGLRKVAYLRKLDFDEAIDHRAGDFKDQLAGAAPDGIDVYFENVSGHVLNAAFPRLNSFARVPVCGLIVLDNEPGLPPGRAEQRVRNLAWTRLRLARQALPTFRSRKSSSACSHHQGRLQS
jgi:NADPH-dependent curcumin reductase CurA